MCPLLKLLSYSEWYRTGVFADFCNEAAGVIFQEKL